MKRPPAERTSTAWLKIAILVVFGAWAVGVGCSSEDALPGSAYLGGYPAPQAGPCTTGAERECAVTLGEHAGVLSCYQGTQQCVEGTWSPCGNGEVRHQAGVGIDRGPEAPKLDMLAFSMPDDCLNNPCDPYCREFIEVPPELITADPDPLGWHGGTIHDYPESLRERGLSEPCLTGNDCQFNSFCSNAATNSQCAHSKCEVGSRLTSNCDPCVAEVCQAQPECCEGPCGPDEMVSSDGLSCYHLTTSRKTWFETRQECQSRGPGWDLARIEDAGKNADVRAFQNNYTLVDLEPGIWVGLHELNTKGNWEWAGGGNASYFSWSGGQPDDSGGPEACVSQHRSGTWHDWDCERPKQAVCEGPAGIAATCAHDICQTGAALSASCSSCAADVCAVKPSCCTTGWDSSCIALVASECGTTCSCGPGEQLGPDSTCYFRNTSSESWNDARAACQARDTGWDLATIGSQAEQDFLESWRTDNTWIGFTDQDSLSSEGSFVWADGSPTAYTAWASGEPNNSGDEDCAEMWDGSVWNDNQCSLNRHSFCEGPAHFIETWDSQCVSLVESTCDVQCGGGSPPASDGSCQPWAPFATDSSCSDIDLSVGVPCDDTLPICNHGTIEAPAGVEVAHFAPGSVRFGECSPDMSGATICTTTEPIAPGECIDLTGCSGLSSEREVMVNPPTASSLGECSCRDNWAIYTPGMTCSAPICSSQVAVNNKSNIYLMATTTLGMRPYWDPVRAGIESFVADPASESAAVGLRVLSRTNNGCAASGANSCDPAACGQMSVPLEALAADARPADAQEQALFDSLPIASTEFGGDYSLRVAVEGALATARSRQMAFPNEDYAVVVLAADAGSGCSSLPTDAAVIAQNYYQDYGIKTHVIALQDRSAFDLIASAGGTGSAIDATTNQSARVQQALESIRGTSSFSCSFDLTSTETEPLGTSVVWTRPGEPEEALPRVGGASACGEGWYVDDLAAPTTLTLCPMTCSSIQSSFGSKVQLRAPCRAPYTGTTASEIYESDCPEGTEVQWAFLAYDADTPLDSSIDFRVRTALSAAQLPAASSISLATASASSSTGEVCPMSGPSPCPANIFETISGLPAARRPALELSMTFNPSSDGSATPILNDWQVTFSCPPAE